MRHRLCGLVDREPMPQFRHPWGYHTKRFAWWADSAVELPPAGTRYAQIIPFKKREHWESELDVSADVEQMIVKNKQNSAKYRRPDGGVSQREVWERRKYQ